VGDKGKLNKTSYCGKVNLKNRTMSHQILENTEKKKGLKKAQWQWQGRVMRVFLLHKL